ncbi:MAG: hypothetical protein IJ752_00875 [Alphaproteobacteria bacterium]|nr:hypothetical protein [Alphaproteobacteria bacterium]
MKKLFLLVLLGLFVCVVSRIADERLEFARLNKVSASVSDALPVVLLSTDEESFEMHLYDNETTRQVLAQLPQKIIMTRWGRGGYVGTLAKQVKEPQDKSLKRRAFFAGEVVLRLKNNTLFLLFGPTPASLTVDVPMLTSAGVAVGRLDSFETLDHLLGVTEFSIQIKQ